MEISQHLGSRTSAWGRWREQVGRASRPVTVTISEFTVEHHSMQYAESLVKLTDPAFQNHQESLDEGQTWGQAAR